MWWLLFIICSVLDRLGALFAFQIRATLGLWFCCRALSSCRNFSRACCKFRGKIFAFLRFGGDLAPSRLILLFFFPAFPARTLVLNSFKQWQQMEGNVLVVSSCRELVKYRLVLDESFITLSSNNMVELITCFRKPLVSLLSKEGWVGYMVTSMVRWRKPYLRDSLFFCYCGKIHIS